MGCGPSYRYAYTDVPEIVRWKPQFDVIKLTEKDVGKIYKIFRKIDKDNSGTIQILEMLNYFDIDRNRFTERVFGIFDEDGSGQIDFREFTISLWNYCTLGKSTLALFAFDLYDKDNSGIIDTNEIQLMLEEIYGKSYSVNKHAQKIAVKIQQMTLATKDVTKDMFRDFLKKHPALLFPAFQMQKLIKKKVLGYRFWKSYTDRRIELSKGVYLSVGQITELLNHNALEYHIPQAHDLKHDVYTLMDTKGTYAKRKKSKETNDVTPSDSAGSARNLKTNEKTPTGQSATPFFSSITEDPRHGPKPIITTFAGHRGAELKKASIDGLMANYTSETGQAGHRGGRRHSTGSVHPAPITTTQHRQKEPGKEELRKKSFVKDKDGATPEKSAPAESPMHHRKEGQTPKHTPAHDTHTPNHTPAHETKEKSDTLRRVGNDSHAASHNEILPRKLHKTGTANQLLTPTHAADKPTVSQLSVKEQVLKEPSIKAVIDKNVRKRRSSIS